MAERFKPCSIDGCNRNAHSSARGCRGYCKAHYQRLWVHGDPLGGRATMDGDPARFITEIAINHTGDDCLIWPFGKYPNGYGHFTIDGKSHGAHRYICELAHGKPPTLDHEASHNCGKGHLGCVAPTHLEWKTTAENQADRVIHNTHSRGERHSLAKLTEENVREIRSLKGIVTQKDLAAQFGVSQSNIAEIHLGRSWAWLD